MELLDLENGELRILKKFENDMLYSEPSSQYEIRTDIYTELISVLTSSPRDDISIEEIVL